MATAATGKEDHSAFLLGSCFQRQVGSQAVARKSLVGTRRGANLRGVSADLHNMNRMITDVAKIDIYDTWWQRRTDCKKDFLQCIRAFFSQEDKRKFVLYYSGHGTTKGNWVLNSTGPDGSEVEQYVSLLDIIGLWDEERVVSTS